MTASTVNLERVSHMIKKLYMMAITLLVKPKSWTHMLMVRLKGLIDEGVGLN